MNEYVIETRQLTKSYGNVLALDRADVHVRRGSVYGLIGDNGAGKSTLLKLLTGQTFATSGTLRLFGRQEEKELAGCRRRTGALIEQPGLIPNMTAGQLLEYYRQQRGIPGKARVEETLRLTGILGKQKCKCKHLSTGQKQRLGLAIALIGEPECLILDEPINGLDPSGIVELRRLFRRLNEEKNMTILLSSHILPELEQTATDFGFLNQGRLLAEIPAKELMEQCAGYLDIAVSEPEKYAALLDARFPGEVYKVLPDQTLQIIRPQKEPEEYGRLAMEYGVVVCRLEMRRCSLEEYYMNLKNGGERTC